MFANVIAKVLQLPHGVSIQVYITIALISGKLALKYKENGKLVTSVAHHLTFLIELHSWKLVLN